MKRTLLAAFCAAMCQTGATIACDVIEPYHMDVMLTAGSDSRLPVAQPAIVSTPINEGCAQDSYADNGQVRALTNEQLANLGNQTMLAPVWQAAQVYVAGDRASFSGVNYTAKWWTQGETPSVANNAWLADATAGLQTWLASAVYTAGNQVVFNGKLYEAKWWTQGEQPGTSWGAWLLKGDDPAKNMPGLFSASIRKLADGQLVVSFVAVTITTYVHRTDGKCGVSATITSDSTGPFGTNWHINLDGMSAYTAPLPMPSLSGTLPPPPPPPRTPDGLCQPAGNLLQTNYALASQNIMKTILPGNHRFVSVWSCSADQQCRPSELLDIGFMGWAGPPIAQYRLVN